MKIIEISTSEKTEKQLYSNRVFIEECINSIKEGIKNNDLIVPIIIVKFDNLEYGLKCHRKEWNIILSKCINYFISTEEYEICQEIKKIIEI